MSWAAGKSMNAGRNAMDGAPIGVAVTGTGAQAGAPSGGLTLNRDASK